MDQKIFTEISNYNQNTIQEEVVIFDTNILVDLFYPGNINRRTGSVLNKIEEIYEDCINQNKKMKIIVPIISEFYNLAFNVAWKSYERNYNIRLRKRKDFRNVSNFNRDNIDIINIIDSFSSQFILEQYNFDYNNIQDKENKLSKLDFTDLIISTFCEEQNACLVTLDKDFKNTFINDLKFSIISNE